MTMTEYPFRDQVQVSSSQYTTENYESKQRFISFWHQINEIQRLGVSSILEIGIGNGMVSTYIEQRGRRVYTLDIDIALEPQIVGSVESLPFAANSVDAIACYEVLEHLPFERFVPILREFHRVSRDHVIISLPDYERAYRFHIQLPRLGDVRLLIPVPRLRRPVHQFDGEHWWEIGKRGYALKTILAAIEESGFQVIETYRIFEHAYHHFFRLRRR
jgi:predicted SAM-dependent methyltransferase